MRERERVRKNGTDEKGFSPKVASTKNIKKNSVFIVDNQKSLYLFRISFHLNWKKN